MTPNRNDDPGCTADYWSNASPPVPVQTADNPLRDEADVTVTHAPGRGALSVGGETAGLAGPIPSVPGYVITTVLGRGGMGVVYKAKHLALNRTVALKMVLTGGHAGPAERARFRTEAEAVARLQHPNIVQIHEVGEADGHPYCALEFVEGGTLAGKLSGQPLPPREAAQLVEILSRAMQAAHDRHVIHRDLKPANILLTPDGAPKITDFGLARHTDSDHGQTQAGAVMGTPAYMSPEQASGRTHEAGPPVDVYALGAILYECLTGRPPFQGATAIEILDRVRTQEPVPPSRIRAKVPFDLETICLKALAKEPARRYPSAGELADDLRRFLDDEPILARRVGVAEKVWRRARKNAIVVGLTAALLMLAVVVAVVALRPRPEPPAPVVTATPEPDTSAEDLLAVVADLDRTDPGWRLEQIEERREVIPDDENGALQIVAFRRMIGEMTGNPRSDGLWETQEVGQRMWPYFERLPTDRLSQADATIFRGELKRMERPLAIARKMESHPRGRVRIALKRDGISVLLPDHQAGRNIASLLRLDILVQIDDGNRSAALMDCRALLNLGQVYSDDPFMIAQIMRVSLLNGTLDILERLLAQAECTDAELGDLQRLLDQAAAVPALVTGARGERASLHNFLSAVATGDGDPRAINDFGGKKKDVRVPSPKELRQFHVWLLRYFTELVAISRQSPEKWATLISNLEQKNTTAPPAGMALFKESGVFSWPQAAEAITRSMARLRSAATAIAVERYRLAHGAWPADLAALVPAYVKEIPKDPHDGQPLRNRRTADGVVIFSIGKDLADNQGELDRSRQKQDGVDIGFQLWDAARRR